MRRLTNNPSQTRKLAEAISKRILKMRPKKSAFVIGLEGDLGGGKTTFLQGLAEGLGIKQKITSPTFVIMKKFNLGCSTLKFEHFYHIDCYRVQKPKEILNLGFKEIISNPQNIVAIEWAEKIKNIIPGAAFWVRFEFINQNTRRITITTKNDN